ncbi:MAG: hypothetical protein GOV00_03470 [Candidatus Altiarchaeota archaeon]|nr:hypothetical protein [Candidatus Altiarchaeota archaeon]
MGLLGKVFGKKGKVGAGDLPARIISLRQNGLSDQDIANQFQAEGVPPEAFEAAMAQANEQMGGGGSGPMGPPPPPPPGGAQMPPPPPGAPMPMGPPSPLGDVTEIETESEDIEVLVEKLIGEKTKGMEMRNKDVEASIGKIHADVHELKNMTVELKEKYAGLQEESLGKVEEYAKELENVGAQIKAMQRILKDIIPTLSDNIIQLQKLVDDIKVKRK